MIPTQVNPETPHFTVLLYSVYSLNNPSSRDFLFRPPSSHPSRPTPGVPSTLWTLASPSVLVLLRPYPLVGPLPKSVRRPLRRRGSVGDLLRVDPRSWGRSESGTTPRRTHFTLKRPNHRPRQSLRPRTTLPTSRPVSPSTHTLSVARPLVRYRLCPVPHPYQFLRYRSRVRVTVRPTRVPRPKPAREHPLSCAPPVSSRDAYCRKQKEL